jgi:NitT/TauT family transport system substrate-binding protein
VNNIAPDSPGERSKMNKPGLILIIVAILYTALIPSGCTGVKTPPDEVILQLKWVHQAQFAGYYVAQSKEYYAQENIKVTFFEGGQNIDVTGNLINGKADFAVLSPEELLTHRSQGYNLKAIATIYRRSAVVFLSMAGSDIKRPRDFPGKTIAALGSGGATEFRIQLLAMLKKLHLEPESMKIVSYDPTYITFINGEVDVTPTYSTGGLIRLRDEGFDLNLIWPDDYGVHFYSDTLVTTGELIDENPDLVKRFLRASLKGWEDAIENYMAAITITLKYAEVADRGIQTSMMEAMLPLIHTGEDHIGWMKPEIWQEMYSFLMEQSLLQKPFDINQAYTMRFLQEIYRNK